MEAVDGAFRMKMLIIGFLIATISKIIADEAKEWMAWLPNTMIRGAAMRFGEGERERFEEEWLAHANDMPGCIGKLWHATGCVVASISVTHFCRETLFSLLTWSATEVLADLMIMLAVFKSVSKLRHC